MVTPRDTIFVSYSRHDATTRILECESQDAPDWIGFREPHQAADARPVLQIDVMLLASDDANPRIGHRDP